MRTYAMQGKEVPTASALREWIAGNCRGGVIVLLERGEDVADGIRSRSRSGIVDAFNIPDMDALVPLGDNQSMGHRNGWATACNFAASPYGWFLAFVFYRDAEAEAFYNQFLRGKI